MTRHSQRFRFPSCLLIGALLCGNAAAEDELAPYKVVRSLQFVQDSVAQGDHSAGEMQRFILETMDERLRAAPVSVFDDPRNVDAALVYAMSGGNPATLEYLVARDIEGNFDSRVIDALRKYFDGQGALVARSLIDMVPEYRDTRIGAYLALVAGNILLGSNVNEALSFFDQARLTAPGTIIEEAALRRSLAISVESNLVPRALAMANRYVRRFLHSPYASQFADLFVQLVVANDGAVTHDDIAATLEMMDAARAREIYLRIARRATLAGRSDLARHAAAEAEARASAAPDDGREVLGSLYGNVAAIPSGDVASAVKAIDDIPDDQLSERDRALRDAARAVAEQIMQTPAVPASHTQVGQGNTVDEQVKDDPVAAPGQTPAGGASDPQADDAYQSFVERGRSQLDAIDALLKQKGMSR
ncbi:chemotaxis protein MotC [Rhizobiaceae bacterium BDR2-2]|uniref:Chemotaxis protein MotC n=1 Tax=Ectorhizobium quercum TaxID=2965071 RepID=A0AAE3SW56_9HYPH|nr:chemotaxis protein MotC [Ectorhizobium quercum]MCX8996119.1 chemotaxis protein MotC [Ectorhizobium quercum]MCX8998842.1 chemotaxis protein MotC [Ectorhizobium quercum]